MTNDRASNVIRALAGAWCLLMLLGILAGVLRQLDGSASLERRTAAMIEPEPESLRQARRRIRSQAVVNARLAPELGASEVTAHEDRRR